MIENEKEYINKCNTWGYNHICISVYDKIDKLLNNQKIPIELFKTICFSFRESCISAYPNRLIQIFKRELIYCKDNENEINDIIKIIYNFNRYYDKTFQIIKFILASKDLSKYIKNICDILIDYKIILRKNTDRYNFRNKFELKNEYEIHDDNELLYSFIYNINEILFKSTECRKYINMQHINSFYIMLLLIEKSFELYYNLYGNDTNTNSNSNKLDSLKNEIINNKNFIPTYDTFLFASCYDKYENMMIIIKSPNITIKDTTLKEYIDILFKSSLIRYIKLNIFQDTLNLLTDNNSNPSLIDQFIIVNTYTNYNYDRNSRYNKNYINILTNIKYLCNFLADNKVIYSDLLFEFTLKNKIKIKNIQYIGIDFTNNKYSSMCFNHNFNPYEIEKKITLELLHGECNKSGNLTKVKTLTKDIKPDIKCLENACLHKNNYHMAYYLCEAFNIKPNIDCVINALNSVQPYLSKYILDEFKINRENKIENKTEKKDIINDNNLYNKDMDINQENIKINEVNNNDDKTDEKPKKIIKRVVKKKVDDNAVDKNDDKTVNNNDDKTDEKPKKIIKRVVKKKVDDNAVDKNDDKIEKQTKVNNDINIQHNINLDEFLIPSTYNYREKYKLSNLANNIFKDDKLDHFDIRKKILIYLKDNNKLNQSDYVIENIKFNMNNLDKFIYAYMIEK
jgi:hypothetical protein